MENMLRHVRKQHRGNNAAMAEMAAAAQAQRSDELHVRILVGEVEEVEDDVEAAIDVV
jgi:hypothetical protein